MSNPQPPAVEFESSDQTMCGKDMATVYSGRSDRFHGLNLLGRLFDLGAQGERDLSAMVAAHNLMPKLLAALDAAEQRAALAQQQAAGYQAAIKREAEMCAAATAAEAQAVEFAWDVLAFSGVCVDSGLGIYDDCTKSSAKSAAEYLAARGLLRKSGERAWQRVEGESE